MDASAAYVVAASSLIALSFLLTALLLLLLLLLLLHLLHPNATGTATLYTYCIVRVFLLHLKQAGNRSGPVFKNKGGIFR